MANKFEILISAVDKASKTIGGVQNAIGKMGYAQGKFSKEQSKGSEQQAKVIEKVGRAFSDQAEQARKLEDAAYGVKYAQSGMFSSAAKFLMPGSALWMAGKMSKEWAESGMEISRVSDNIGISTGRLQQFRGAAKLTGLSSDSMTAALANLGDTLQGAEFGRNPEAATMLNTLGISIKRTKDGVVDTTAAMFDLSRAVSGISDPNVQRKMVEPFGLESILPLLRQGPAALAEAMRLATELNAQTKEQLELSGKVAKNWESVSEAFSGLKNEIGSKLSFPLKTAEQFFRATKHAMEAPDSHSFLPPTVQFALGYNKVLREDQETERRASQGFRTSSGKINGPAFVQGAPGNVVPGTGAPPPDPDDKSSVGSVIANFDKVERKYGLPKNLLSGMWGAESSFGKNQFNPTSGATGNFQWMPETAARYGVKPGDLDSEADGVGRYMSDLHRKRGTWKGALFDYNGVVNNVGSGEDYVRKIQKLGGTGDLDGGASAPTYTLEQLSSAIIQALNQQSVNVHVSGLPAGATAKATARDRVAMTTPTRISYTAPTQTTP